MFGHFTRLCMKGLKISRISEELFSKTPYDVYLLTVEYDHVHIELQAFSNIQYVSNNTRSILQRYPNFLAHFGSHCITKRRIKILIKMLLRKIGGETYVTNGTKLHQKNSCDFIIEHTKIAFTKFVL